MLTQKKIIIIFAIGLCSLAIIPISLNVLTILSTRKEAINYKTDNSATKNKTSARLYDMSDPFVTKAANLNKMLTGPIITDIDEVFGLSESPVTVTYFGDYTCKYCLAQISKIKKIIKNEYSDKVKLVWKDFPLSDDTDTNSYKLAIAARCAGEQGKFWDYQDTISGELTKENIDLHEYANKSGLDIEPFNECLQTPDKIRKIILDNKKEGNALNITGVPFIYINKQEFMGEISDNEFKRVVEIESRN